MSTKKPIFRVSLLLTFVLLTFASTNYAKSPKKGVDIPTHPRYDVAGNIINAHGAGILFHKNKYYWYGEIKGDSTYRYDKVKTWECYRTEAGGVSCYSSRDLRNWKYEGVALAPVTNDPTHAIHPSQVIERPKVIYNRKTKQFVMWLHVDSPDYSRAAVGIATSKTPEGPFTYLNTIRPLGNDSRDMTLFKDDDERAYLVSSAENNATMHIYLLNDTYTDVTQTFTKAFERKYREAPAVFKRDHTYYMITSGCTGWVPNEARYAVADSMLGNWTLKGNPCVGEGAKRTFEGQSTFVLPVKGKKELYIALFDQWNKTNLKDSRYLWLPIEFKGEEMVIKNKE